MKANFFLSLFLVISSTVISVMGQNTEIKPTLFSPDHKAIRYCGRIDSANPQQPKFISAGSYFTFDFTGTSCNILLENQNEGDGYSFISVECDGKYMGRIKIVKGQEKYTLVAGLDNKRHTILVCKATEAITGYIELRGIECSTLQTAEKLPIHRIEFIGNSITSGAECDLSEYPCNSGIWHDRHNAYLAYGPSIARLLNADWVLSSVSGMGLTRNWNTEGPALPAFYDNLYLNGDSSQKWAGKEYNPELVNICLGTNDNSGGDGSYDRKPLDSTKFVNEYTSFVKHIRYRYPNAVICLINSPVFDGDLKVTFQGYLEATINSIKKETGDQKVYFFSYLNKYEGGCSGHPNTDEHQKMANELLPFIKKITGW